MKFDKNYQSSNVEDRRYGGGGGGGGGIRIPGGAKGGIGGLIIVVLAAIFGKDIINTDSSDSNDTSYNQSPANDPDKDLKAFISQVFDNIQNLWTAEFQKRGKSYQMSKLVLFTGETSSGCGNAEAAIGPFYCPADRKSYIDFGFYRELKSQLGAPGDFAQAYVIAHEVGHHVQNLTGVNSKVNRLSKADPSQENELSIRQELQADCYAGIWAKSAQQQGLLDPGDIDEALRGAAAVGDDALQKMATGRVQPETWTHGSSAQRTKWFKKGFTSGSMESCDTFAIDNP